ncbi:MAG: hypothetical protein IJA86_04920 [Clostridia bacterium]|nr:hypothetical protein [Clostridia bacterium]
MYCIKCGVALADTEKHCPLCGTVVYHPELTQKEAPPTYPPYRKPKQRINRRGVLFLISVIYLILAAQLFVCEFSIFNTFHWSLYAVGGLIFSYIAVILPMWFYRPNPVIFVPCDFAAAALYLWFINELTNGDWFLTFACPIAFGTGLLTTAILALSRYLRKGKLFVFGGASVLVGALTVMIEILLSITFALRFYFWSVYPLIGFVLLGIALIIIGVCRPLRESLTKKFFV